MLKTNFGYHVTNKFNIFQRQWYVFSTDDKITTFLSINGYAQHLVS